LKDIQYNGQKFEDTKGVIRSLKLKKDKQYNGQKFEDSNGVIRSVKVLIDTRFIDVWNSRKTKQGPGGPMS